MIWAWYNVLEDLVSQGGLERDKVEWSFRDPSLFLYKGKPFCMTWVKDRYLLVSMKNDDEDLETVVDALSKVVEYRPFCKYKEPESLLTTYEWDKLDPGNRYEEIKTEGKIDIQKID